MNSLPRLALAFAQFFAISAGVSTKYITCIKFLSALFAGFRPAFQAVLTRFGVFELFMAVFTVVPFSAFHAAFIPRVTFKGYPAAVASRIVAFRTVRLWSVTFKLLGAISACTPLPAFQAAFVP